MAIAAPSSGVWPPWPRRDERGVARYASSDAGQWHALPSNRFDLERQTGRLGVVRALYDSLRDRGIHYALEAYHPSDDVQLIRPPAEILGPPGEGTCLDLSLLFCGLAMAFDLLPVLVVTQGHALVAVSLKRGLREWNGYGAGAGLFADEPVTDAAALRELLDNGDLVAVECTGFAHSTSLRRGGGDGPEVHGRRDGYLTFDQAVEAGRRQFDLPERPLQFAIDIAIAHYRWRFEPHGLGADVGATALNIFRLIETANASPATALPTLRFKDLVEERTREFVGRDFIFHDIDRHLADPRFPSGYILVRGEPGVGKTALMAQLVKTRGYVHHFNVASSNIVSTRAFLENVCAQLIIRYGLPYSAIPPDAGQDSSFLSEILAAAAESAGASPIIVAVDALDEADDVGLPPAANRLFLPRSLPNGVYFVLTSREIDYRLEVDARRDVPLLDDSPQNLADARHYVAAFLDAHRSDMAPRISAWNISEPEFIEELTRKSQGNFMYLAYVLPDILEGRLIKESVDRVSDLPIGLDAYYKRHWRSMRAMDQERFERIYEPVLRFLATVREPICTGYLQKLTGLPPERIADVIRDWRGFLNEERNEHGQRLYRVYHASFQEFLAVEGMGLAPMHLRITQMIMSKVPGLLSDGDGLGST